MCALFFEISKVVTEKDVWKIDGKESYICAISAYIRMFISLYILDYPFTFVQNYYCIKVMGI